MAKLYALMDIIRQNDAGTQETIARKSVFDSSGAEFAQFTALKFARPATADEITAAGQIVPTAPAVAPAPAAVDQASSSTVTTAPAAAPKTA